MISNTNTRALSEGGIEQEHQTPPALDVVEHKSLMIFGALLEVVQKVIVADVDLEPFVHDFLVLLSNEMLRHLMKRQHFQRGT